VLLIEDEPSTRLLLIQKFRSAGLDVDVAVNGKLALEKIRTGHPDAIFMDLLLPRVKGVDVIKAARNCPEFADRPIYVCTSAALMQVWTRRGTKAGATKVFDRASTPIDAIVAEVAATLLGRGPSTATLSTTPELPSPQEFLENPTSPETSGIPEPPAQDKKEESSVAQSPSPPFNFMKRVVKSFGLGWIRNRSSGSGAPASSEPIQPAQEIVASAPSVDPVHEASSADDGMPAMQPDYQSADGEATRLDGIGAPATEVGVAVLTLDEAAKILSANKNCTTLFGWEGPALVGQNLKCLLKDGLEEDIRKLLEQQRSGDESKLTCPLLTVARRKDGTEFPVSITTLTWSSDTTMMRKSDASVFCWTAFIRDMANPTGSQGHQTASDGLSAQVAGKSSMPQTTGAFHLQENYASLQKANDTLQKRLQESSNEAAARHDELAKREQEHKELGERILRNQADLDKARTDLEREVEERKQLEQKLQELGAKLEKQTAERARLEAEWSQQLKSAEALTKKLEAGWTEEAGRHKGLEERIMIFGNSLRLEQAERSKRFEQEVMSLRNERDELYGRLTEEQLATVELKRRTEELETRLHEGAAEADRVKEELERLAEEQGRLEVEWRQKLNTAEGLTHRLETAWVESEEQNKRTEEELTSLRRIQDELKGKLAAEQQAAAESVRRNDELAAHVIENAVELERIKVELEKVGHNEQFEEQLKRLEQVRRTLSGELRTEQQATAESKQRSEEIENRLRENSSELERVKADAEKHAAEQARLESELQTQLDEANSAAEQAEAALKEKASQCSQFEVQLATLERLRDELGGKLATEQQAAAESKQRSQDLEKRLQESAAELERVKAERDNQAEAQARLESELRSQLDAAKASAEQAAAALNEQTAQNRGFEERLRIFGNSLRLQQVESTERFQNELNSLQQVRDELGGKLAAEQQAAAESKQRSEEIGKQLRETTAELERVRTELARHAEERTRLESEHRAQLEAGKTETEKAEASRLEEAERSKRIEAELVELRRERDELNNRFTSEQQAVMEAREHGRDLENRLRETAARLEQVQTELARHAEERAQYESEHHAKLSATKTETEKAEAAWLEEAERNTRFEEELAELRQQRDELNQKFTSEQQAVAESRRQSQDLENRLRETAGELDRVKTDLAKQAEERSNLTSEQRAQIDAAKSAAEQAEAALTQKAALCDRFQQEASNLWQECETLSAKLAAEQRAAADFKRRSEELEDRVRENAAELEEIRARQSHQAEEQRRLESEWREQLVNAQESATQATEELKEAVVRQRQLERSLANLRNERHQVYDKFKVEHAALEKSKRRIGELEKKLRQRTTENQHSKSALEKQAAERGLFESELRGQLEAARASAEREMESLRREREELKGRLNAEQQAATDFRQRGEEFEKRLNESAAELERVKGELDRRATEWTRLESEQRNFADARDAIGLELRHLREKEAAHKAEVSEMEGRLAESIALLARSTTELESERAERHRLDQRATSLVAESQNLHEELKQHLESEQANEHRIAALMQQLREREEAVTRISMDLQKEMVDRQSAEEHLRATADMSNQLRDHLGLIEDAKKVFESRQKDLESRLQASLNALRESESSMEKENGERRRLEEALDAARRESQRQSESNAIELSRLQSAIQVEQLERKGLEAQAIQSRYSSLDSARVGAAMVNNFRNRIRQPIDKLMESTRRLLESQLADEHKKLVESLLENALFLQTNVRENGPSNEPAAGESGRNPRESDAARSTGVIPTEANSGLQP
jgi:chromosome segregation ATPase/CheY-like chemotaxis protein